jgi:hypothetical protein
MSTGGIDDPEYFLLVQIDVDREAFDRPSPDVLDAMAVGAGRRRKAPRPFFGNGEIATGHAEALDGGEIGDAPSLEGAQYLGTRFGDAVLHLELFVGDVRLHAGDLAPRR